LPVIAAPVEEHRRAYIDRADSEEVFRAAGLAAARRIEAMSGSA